MQLRGRVVQGLGLGAKLGYPTANLECGDTRHIQSGVYAARATVDGATYNTALIIGARSENGQPLIEAHLLDFHGNLRGKELTIDLLERVSEIEPFDDEKSLLKKIEQDIQKVRGAICLQG